MHIFYNSTTVALRPTWMFQRPACYRRQLRLFLTSSYSLEVHQIIMLNYEVRQLKVE